MTDLKGKTALVTGSTSGIGQATVIGLAARGAHVLVVGRNEQRAKDVVAEIEGKGGSASFKLTTLSDLQSARSWSMGHGGRRRSRRHPHQQRWRRRARTKQRGHRGRVR